MSLFGVVGTFQTQEFVYVYGDQRVGSFGSYKISDSTPLTLMSVKTAKASGTVKIMLHAVSDSGASSRRVEGYLYKNGIFTGCSVSASSNNAKTEDCAITVSTGDTLELWGAGNKLAKGGISGYIYSGIPNKFYMD